MEEMIVQFQAELVFQQFEKAAWYYVILPQDEAAEVRFFAGSSLAHMPKRGFNSIKVAVTVGDMRWKTSIFPDRKHNSYFLPIKKEARVKESMQVGALIDMQIEIL